MKKIIACVLIICTLVTLFSACNTDNGVGSEVCLTFIGHIYRGEYAAAYELIDEDIKNLTDKSTVRGEPYISFKEFTDKHNNIFNAIGLDSLSYEIKSKADGKITASVEYDMSFVTELAGTLTYNYVINAEYKNERWCILWSPKLIFPSMEWGDNILSGVNYPSRGEIFDANGEILASNLSPFTVFCTPSKIKEDEREQFIQDVLALTELDIPDTEERSREQRVRDAANSKNSTVVLCTMYPDEIDDALKERILAIKGLGIDLSSALTSTDLRYYPYGNTLAHILGFASIIQEKDLKAFKEAGSTIYDGDSWLGYSGLELEYEELLRGSKGSFAYIQGVDGTNRQTLYNIPAVNGQDLHLSIKINVQQRVEEVVNTIVFDDKINGTVIVMNPQTGAVEAMYSWPDFDPNDFSRGNYTPEEWQAMQDDINAPLLNRAVQGLYPPGSTFKPLTAAALLETGTFTTDTLFPATERVKWDVWYPSVSGGEFAYTGISRITRTENTNRHTPMNMKSSIIDSDNLYFSYGALKMGWDLFIEYLTKIGMTEAVPFDGVVTQKAQIINAETKINTKDSVDYFRLATTGYGQGELLVTPLQMATFISAFANGGVCMTPYILDSIWEASGIEYNNVYSHEPSEWKTICSEVNCDIIADMLYNVCRPKEERGGTGRQLRVFSYLCAGKTGTAEVGAQIGETKDKEKELAWFIAFRYKNKDGSELAAEDQRLVLVMLEIEPGNLSTNYADTKTEYSSMKFLIAQELLKDDVLTGNPVTENIMVVGEG